MAIVSGPSYIYREQNIMGSQEESNLFFSPEEIGGKAYNLQTLQTIDGIDVPYWVVVQTDVMQSYLSEHDLVSSIHQLDLLCKDFQNYQEEIQELSEKIRQTICSGDIGKKAKENIEQKIGQLNKNCTHQCYAVRSSAIIEDSHKSSFAGLYETILGVEDIDQIITAIKKVWASSFHIATIQQRADLSLSQNECLMGVIIQEMIDPYSSGVISTCVLSNGYPGIQITANYGLGESVVGGEISCDSYVWHSKNYILEKYLGTKERQIILDSNLGVKEVDIELKRRNQDSLTEEEMKNLLLQARLIQQRYDCDVDIEFAIRKDGLGVILQARSLVDLPQSKIQTIDAKAHLEEILVKGNFSVPGVASGKIIFVEHLEDLASGKITISSQDIVLAYSTSNVWTQYLINAAALITASGSPSSHQILLCREKAIPCVIGMDLKRFEKLIELNGELVTVDGYHRLVYQGEIATVDMDREELKEEFLPISLRKWPTVEELLPSLIQNQMVIESEGKYWRKTPTYRVKGFQKEINLLRFDYIREILGRDVAIEARFIDGFVCNVLSPFEEYVALFDGFTLPQAISFHRKQRESMQRFVTLAANINDAQSWQEYIREYAYFRAYIWLGAALRFYAERWVDEQGMALELPSYYLEEASCEIQSKIEEIDSKMHEDLYQLASEMQQSSSSIENLESLEREDFVLFQKIRHLAQQYRFEHQSSLDKPLNIEIVHRRLLKEMERIKKGEIFITQKGQYSRRSFLLGTGDLREWLKISIENRVLQSDAHHVDARAKALARPQLLALGGRLVKEGELEKREAIFELSIEKVARALDEK